MFYLLPIVVLCYAWNETAKVSRRYFYLSKIIDYVRMGGEGLR